ncbi:unnamed protein product [Allacma fusca]|uniref:Uncharacterized protein n=1 Tax=Allacma fusca TaxID=39272 RepID=A0A8J2JMX1_9HEXA|nr:unnamed protein product [Allacma fusca]
MVCHALAQRSCPNLDCVSSQASSADFRSVPTLSCRKEHVQTLYRANELFFESKHVLDLVSKDNYYLRTHAPACLLRVHSF